MNLGKPPIVQAWIEFRFDRGADGPEWGLATASAFFDVIQGSYPEREVLAQHQLKIEKIEKNQRPRIVDEQVQVVGMRASTSSKNRCIQLFPDVLSCNFARSQSSGYEGFEALKAEALAKFRAYLEFFRPARLMQATIHYVDLVRIPFKDDQVELAEYFTFTRDLSDSVFGNTLGFNVQYTTQPPSTKDLLEVRLNNEQSDPEGPTAQFRMEWRQTAFDGLSLTEDGVSRRLSEMHDMILGCFKKSFTDKGWALFEPKP
jgi:uncharacterized protein (TIGR04255 family)